VEAPGLEAPEEPAAEAEDVEETEKNETMEPEPSVEDSSEGE
jgi:hypothetical protein